MKTTQTPMELNGLLTVSSNNIQTNVKRIDNSQKIVILEKSKIKKESAELLINVMNIIKTDFTALDEINPTYHGLNHLYIKVQSVLSKVGEIEKSTDKIIKAILNTILCSKDTDFSKFVVTLKDLELFNKFQDNLGVEHLGSNESFIGRINTIIEAKTFVAMYNDPALIHSISKELRSVLSKVECAQDINGVMYESWNVIIKTFKIEKQLLADFISALATAKSMMLQNQAEATQNQKVA